VLDKVKVLHIAALNTAVRNIGVLRQMQAERDAARDLRLCWDMELWAADAVQGFDFVHTYPADCRTRIARRRHFFQTVTRHSNMYDLILLRYMPADPFLPFLRRGSAKVGLVLHTKDGPALRSQFKSWKGAVLATVDWISSQVVLRKADGLVAVTGDILEYHLRRGRLAGVPTIVVPNGIDLSRFPVVKDRRDQRVKLLFTASSFFSWHGLHELLTSLVAYPNHDGVELHLVGDVFDSELKLIENAGLRDCVTLHGRLDMAQIRECLSWTDVGIASFGLGESGLKEACTLKVREYLAAGVPVFSGHRDSAFPDGFEFYKVGPADVGEIVKFAVGMKQVDRQTVRQAATDSIDKRVLVSRLNEWAESVCSDATN
jgi:glycosyltransferase involved in cell wall biosynthesis